MTAALPVAEKIRTRYRTERQRFSEAQYVLRPAERLRVQAEAVGDFLGVYRTNPSRTRVVYRLPARLVRLRGNGRGYARIASTVQAGMTGALVSPWSPWPVLRNSHCTRTMQQPIRTIAKISYHPNA